MSEFNDGGLAERGGGGLANPGGPNTAGGGGGQANRSGMGLGVNSGMGWANNPYSNNRNPGGVYGNNYGSALVPGRRPVARRNPITGQITFAPPPAPAPAQPPPNWTRPQGEWGYPGSDWFSSQQGLPGYGSWSNINSGYGGGHSVSGLPGPGGSDPNFSDPMDPGPPLPGGGFLNNRMSMSAPSPMGLMSLMADPNAPPDVMTMTGGPGPMVSRVPRDYGGGPGKGSGERMLRERIMRSRPQRPERPAPRPKPFQIGGDLALRGPGRGGRRMA